MDVFFLEDAAVGNTIGRSKSNYKTFRIDNDRKFGPLVTDASKQAFIHARDVVKGRWSEGEATILESSYYPYMYARYVLKERWLEGEAIIMRHELTAYLYAEQVIKGRWPEGEHIILANRGYAMWYDNMLNNP